MSFDSTSKKWARGFSYQDLMRPHANIALRTDPGMSELQAKTVRHVASFYPPVVGFVLPGPAENCPVRSKLQERMKKITDTMDSMKRVVPKQQESTVLVADFYPSFYQLTKVHIQGICELIRQKENIVGVKVTEEAIHAGLGGYRVAFSVNMTEKPKQLIRQLQSKLEQTERMLLENPPTLKALKQLHLAKQAFWKK